MEVKRNWGQKSLTLRVPFPGQLRVSGPKSLLKREVFRFLEENGAFIERCESEWKLQYSKASIQHFRAGETCIFLGRPRKLEFLEKSGRANVLLNGDQIQICQSSFEPAEVQKTLIRFFKKTGINYLSHLVRIQSEKMELYPVSVSFRSQKSRWGSCSSAGQISLNWRLVLAPSEVAEYVVIHELAHLQHQNHSSNFWNLVENHCPQFKQHKKWLKDNHVQFEFLDPNYLSMGAFFESTKTNLGL